MNWEAVCQDCKYHLRNRGKVGTESYGIRHALKKKHFVVVNDGRGNFTYYDKRATLKATEHPPF